MADLVEPDPSLPVYCVACEQTVCARCGRMGAAAPDPDYSGICVMCADATGKPARRARTSHEQAAYELGCMDARNAASWIVNGNLPQQHIRYLLDLMESLDPQMDFWLPRRPNLSGESGEYADDPTPQSLYEEVTGRCVADADADMIDAIADAYEDGVADTFDAECERILRAALTD